MNLKLDLIDLDVEVRYDYEPPSTGAIDENGRTENLPASVIIYSVLAFGDADLPPVEIITLIDKDTLEQMEVDVLKKLTDQD